MWPLSAAAGSVIGGAISAGGSYASAKSINKQATEQANTGVQRRVADMKKAGINPILAASPGAAAPVANLQKPDFSPIAGISNATSARMQAESGQKQANTQAAAAASTIELQKAQSAKTVADTAVSLEAAKTQQAQQNLTNEQALTQGAVRAKYAADTGLTNANSARVAYQSSVDKVISDYVNTPTGAESVRTSFDNKTGGRVGAINTISGYIDRLFGGGSSPHSAKAVSDNSKKLAPTPHQKGLITIYDKNGRPY